MTTRQILDTWFDKYLRDAVPSERVDELVESLDTLFRDTAKECVPEKRRVSQLDHGTDREYINSGYNQAIRDFNQNIEKRFDV